MAGELLAVQITERALAVFKIPVTELRHNTTGVPIVAGETGASFNFDLSANVLLLQGEVSATETETSIGMFQFTLPPHYMAAGDVSLRLKCNNIGGGTQTSCTITVAAYESDGNGAVAGDLGPGSQTHTAKATWYTKTFTITSGSLVAGDTLNITIQVANIEGGTGSLVWTCDEVAMLCDVQG